MLKIIPFAGAIIGGLVGAFIDGNPWRGAALGAFAGGAALPVMAGVLWVLIARLGGFTVS